MTSKEEQDILEWETAELNEMAMVEKEIEKEKEDKFVPYDTTIRHFFAVECHACGGEGTIWLVEPEPKMQCDDCWGYGYIWEEKDNK